MENCFGFGLLVMCCSSRNNVVSTVAFLNVLDEGNHSSIHPQLKFRSDMSCIDKVLLKHLVVLTL